jgi:hypothetical protein
MQLVRQCKRFIQLVRQCKRFVQLVRQCKRFIQLVRQCKRFVQLVRQCKRFVQLVRQCKRFIQLVRQCKRFIQLVKLCKRFIQLERLRGITELCKTLIWHCITEGDALFSFYCSYINSETKFPTMKTTVADFTTCELQIESWILEFKSNHLKGTK